MPSLLERALKAKRESKHIEFKENFDLNSPRDWCEIIKDIVAISNSGGGVILFGVDNLGNPIGIDTEPFVQLDLADISDKIFKYTKIHFSGIEIEEHKKRGKKIVSFLVEPVSIPIVFTSPGTYSIDSGKQKTAFGIGTVYFRHGAKSEPGNSEDIRKLIERELETTRKSWIKGVRKVVQAPKNSQIITVFPKVSSSGKSAFRIVNDPNAPTINITRDHKDASGIFVHEELSDGIFDEINNVVDANFVLTKGQKQFLFGSPLYYRIYAERQHVKRNRKNLELLANTSIFELYSPGLYWLLQLPYEACAKLVASLFRNPKNPHVYFLLKFAILLGSDFSDWLFEKWKRKWHKHPQPPSFFWTFQEMKNQKNITDRRVIALRTVTTQQIKVFEDISGIQIKHLLDSPPKAASLLSQACMLVFKGHNDRRPLARQLDCLAYGKEIEKRADNFGRAIISEIGEEEAGELATENDELAEE